MEKEYDKLSLEQLQQLIGELPEIRKQRTELPEALKASSKEKLADLIGDGIVWSNIYELSFVEHIAFLIMALDKVNLFISASQAADPQQVILDDMKQDDPEWTGGHEGKFTKADLVGLVASVQRSVFSIMIYQRSLSALVAEVRDGNDDALFNAIRLDRSMTSCPTIAQRISKAELLNDKHFFRRLIKAHKGPSQKHWQSLQDLRYAFAVLRELGFDKLSDAELEDLLVHKLKVYPNTPNARRNLRKQYTLSKKITTT